MRLAVSFPAWEALLARIGARPVAVRLDRAVRAAAPTFAIETGIETTIEDLGQGPYGNFTLAGQSVVVYIRDKSLSYHSALTMGAEQRPRFHFRECRTLNDMRKAGRIERYVAIRPSLNSFVLDARNQRDEIEGRAYELLGCHHCLYGADHKGFRRLGDADRERLKRAFDFAEFFARNDGALAAAGFRDAATAPVSTYTPDWPQVSEKAREAAKWRCQNPACGAKLYDHRDWLHVHHRNGVRNDNRPENLMVLCVLCHAEEPHHRHMTVPAAARAEILRRRGRP